MQNPIKFSKIMLSGLQEIYVHNSKQTNDIWTPLKNKVYMKNMWNEHERNECKTFKFCLKLQRQTSRLALIGFIMMFCSSRYFPFGIIFLVAGKILDMQDPSTLGKKLGWYGVTVLTGLFVHGLVLLPLFYFLLTRKNPFSYIRGLLQALVIALATSSRSALL